MAKLKVGWDLDSKDMIDPYSNPTPHLRKIAQCAEDGVPIPPALAAWITSVHRNLRLIHRKRGGRPTRDSPEAKRQAVGEIVKLCATGVTDLQAIESVHERLQLRVAPSTVFDWLAQHRKARREAFEENVAWSRGIALKHFKELLIRGVADEDALVKVSSIRDWPAQPDREQLERWQGEAAYEVATARLKKR